VFDRRTCFYLFFAPIHVGNIGHMTKNRNTINSWPLSLLGGLDCILARHIKETIKNRLLHIDPKEKYLILLILETKN